MSDTAPANARRFVKSLREVIGTERLEDTQLLVSELVTNVYRHALFGRGVSPTVWVTVLGNAAYVRCEVSDNSTGFTPPYALHPREDRSGGWGLHLVDKLSSEWGTHGKDSDGSVPFCVWFELSHP